MQIQEPAGFLPEPEKPNGDTNMPPASVWAQPTQRPLTEADTQDLSSEEANTLIEWWPYCMNRHSDLLGREILTAADIFEHARRHMAKVNGNAPSKEEADDAAWMSQRKEQKATLAKAKEVWRARVAERKAALATWDAYVEEARLEMRKAQDAAKAVNVVKP